MYFISIWLLILLVPIQCISLGYEGYIVWYSKTSYLFHLHCITILYGIYKLRNVRSHKMCGFSNIQNNQSLKKNQLKENWQWFHLASKIIPTKRHRETDSWEENTQIKDLSYCGRLGSTHLLKKESTHKQMTLSIFSWIT